MGGEPRARRPARADPVRAAPAAPRAAARLGGAAAPDPRGRRPRQGRPLREGLRVPRGRAADPRRRAARRRGRRADPRDRRRASSRRPTTSPRCARRSTELVAPLPERRPADGRAPRARRATGSRAAPASRSSPSSCARCETRGQQARPRSPTSSSSRRSSRSRSRSSSGRSPARSPLRRPHGALPRRVRGRPARRRRPALRLRRASSRPASSSPSCSSTWSASSTSRPSRRSRSGRRGWSSSCSTSSSSSPGSPTSRGARERFYWRTLGVFMLGIAANAVYGVVQLAAAEVAGLNLDQRCSRRSPAARARSTSTARSRAQDVYRPNALTGDPNHLGIMLLVPLLVLTPLYLRLERGHRLRLPLALAARVPARRRARDALAERPARARRRPRSCSRSRTGASSRSRELLLPLAGVGLVAARRAGARAGTSSRPCSARASTPPARGTSTHFDVYDFIPDVLSLEPALRARAEQLLGLLRVRHRPDELRPALVLRRHARRDRASSGRCSSSPSSSTCSGGSAARVSAALGRGRRRRRARVRPLAWGLTAALVGTIAANAFYLTMSFYYFYAFATARARGADRLRAEARLKVVVLTTSYPRYEDDVAGRFVRDAVERVRARGVEVEVVSPASFRHFGIAYGHGIAGNLRRRPWLVLLLPALPRRRSRAPRAGPRATPTSCTRTGSRPALVALADRQAVRRPALGHGRRARAPRAVARPAAAAPRAARGRRLGRPRRRGARARRARGRASSRAGVELPAERRRAGGAAARPLRRPALAGEGHPRVPRRDRGPAARDRRRRAAARSPEALGFVPPAQLGAYYERAAVVCVPSRREGYGVVAREAMAYGRPVVATAVGGLVDASRTAVTGLLVPANDPPALRAALERLLADAEPARAPRGGRDAQPSTAQRRGRSGCRPARQLRAECARDEQARSHHRRRRPGRLAPRGAAARRRATRSSASSGASLGAYPNLDDVRDRIQLLQADLLDQVSLAQRAARPPEPGRGLQPRCAVVRADVLAAAGADGGVRRGRRDRAARGGAPRRPGRSRLPGGVERDLRRPAGGAAERGDAGHAA